MNSNNFIHIDRNYALDLLKSVNLTDSIKQHSIKVASKGLEIANKICKRKVNKRLIEIGGLLHDIGRSITHDFNHGFVGGQILKEKGFSKDFIRICETHVLGGLDKDDAKTVGMPERNYFPISIEEKIVCLADKYLIGTKEVSIEDKLNHWFNKYGKTAILAKSRNRIKSIENEIRKLM